MKRILFFAVLVATTFAYSQSGPGGQGKTDGTSNLVLWLRADTGVLEAAADDAEDGDVIFQWTDLSGYGYHAAFGNGTPVYDASNTEFNGLASIDFNDAEDEYLFIEDDADEAPMLDNTTGLAAFIVLRSDNAGGVHGIVCKRDGYNSNESYSFFQNGNMYTRISGNTDAGNALSTSTTQIFSTTWQAGDFEHWLNQTSGGTSTGGSSPIASNNSDLNIGTFQPGDGRDYDGDIAEIIIYREYLTNAERIVVESYLASKYGITLTDDHWDEATYSSYNALDYTNEISGIGQHTDGSAADAGTSGVLSISGGDDLANGEWLFWGHDAGDFTTYSGTEVPGTEQRLAREWVINETGELGNVTVSIAASDLPASGLVAPDYYLLVDTDGDSDLSDATAYPMTLTGGNYEVDVNLDEGDVIAISFEAPVPAGVTSSLAFWFNSSSGVENSGIDATDGQAVTTWQDISVNDVDAQNGTAPTFYTSRTVNYHPVVHFDKASSEYLEFDITGLEQTDYSILAVVQRASSTGSQYVFGSEDNQADAMAAGYSSNTQLDLRNSSTDNISATVPGFDSSIEGPVVLRLAYNGSGFEIVGEYKEGTYSSSLGAFNQYAATGYTGNLGRALAGNYFDGDILEIVAFDAALSGAEYNAVETNLAIKYGVGLIGTYYDELSTLLWTNADNAGFQNDVTAIGYDESFGLDQRISKAATDSVVISTVADFTSLNSDGGRSSLSDGQYVFVSNDDDPFNFDQTHNGSPNTRLDRTWRVREVGAPGEVVIAVKSSAVDANVLLVSSDPTFSSGVTELSLATVGEYVFATHDFSDGDYFTFVNDPSEIWYSYISGNWSNPQNWTLDGAISALYVNPDSKIPTAGDSVVVKSGRTITMDVNNVNVTKVELIGTLNVGSTSGHDFGYLEGNGTLRLSGNGGLDNYPTAIDTAFYDALEGGTVRYYGASDIVLDQTRRYNNLVINMNNNSQLVTMTGDSIYVYGDFTVNRGIFQINDNSATDDLAILVEGDMIVEANGTFDVGTGSARHELNLYGDFTNYGDVDFTNRTSQTTGSEAGNGIVDFNLLSGTRDQAVTLEGPTHFYRIEVDKGTDKTYIADIQASDPSYFELYGAANYDHGAVAQLTTNNNAVGLVMGTLKIGTNIDLGPLNTVVNYNISEGAELWINGGTAYKNSGTAIVPYGNIRVSAGTLDADVQSGITSRANGTLYMEGGEVTIRQFRTSIFGATNQGGIVQTGGILNITGNTGGDATNTNYCPLNLTYSGNAFIMSGGVMNVSGANTKGGVFINSDTENILTGGTLNFISNTTNPFIISSRAGFFNLNLTKTSASGGDFVVMTNQSGPNGTDETIEDLPLEILNDLTLDNTDGNTVTLDMSGNDLEVQGSFNIGAGSSTNLTDMMLIFGGAGSSQFNIGLATTLVLDSLQINKNEELVTTNITNGADPAIQVDHYFNVTSGNFNIDSYNVIVNGDLNVADTVGTATSTGIVSLTGAALQSMVSSSGVIYDLLIDNANGINLDGNLGVMGQLALNTGVIDINTSKLTLTAQPTTTGAFSSTTMIQTNGNASDGGLEYYFDGLTADPASLLFPIGTDANVGARYTPVNLDIESITDDGFISFSLADTELATTDPAGGTVLDYYWKLNHSGFTAVPDISALSFVASELDDVDGSDGNAADDGTSLPDNWVTGKVENAEDSDDAGTNIFDAIETPGSISTYTATYTGNDTGNGVGTYSLSKANFTLGEAARFATSPTIFYTRKTTNNDQNWNVAGNWSTVATQGAAASRYPGQGGNSNDIVIIGAHDSDDHGFSQEPVRLDVNINTDIAALIFEEAETGESRGRVFPQSGTTHSWGEVSGDGEIQLFFSNSGNVPTFDAATTDFGGFFSVLNSTWNLAHEGGAGTGNRVTMPAFPNEFPSLRVTATGGGNGGTDGWGSQRQVEFANDITVNNNLEVANRAALYVQGDMDVANDLSIGVGFGHGRLRFPNGATSYTLNIGGSIYLGETTGGIIDENYIDVESGNTNDVTHYLNVSGDIVLTENSNGSDPVLDLYLSANENQVQLTLEGEGVHTFTNDSNVDPDLYRLVLNKGSDTTSVFTMQTNFTLNGANNVEPAALEIQKGKLVLDDVGISFEIANGIDYSIPEGSGLEVLQGAVTMDGSVVILDGLLKVDGGSVTLTDTDIEYSNTGYALIEVSSGSFEVGNIIRRAITTATGILKYRQSGGTVLIASDNAPTYSPSRAAFEVANPDSEFTLTGGSFTIQRGVTGDNNISLLLTPDTYDVTGSTITLGNANTPSYGANYFNLKTSVPLNNLTIFDDGDDNFPPIRLLSLPLVVNGTLDIASNAGLIANGFSVTLNGDFNNDGVYTNSSSTTTLGSETGQSITGGGTFTIYNLTKTGAGEAQTNQNLVLNRNLRVEEGILNMQDYTISLKNDAYIQSTLSNSTISNGLVFNGTSNQDLYGVPNNTVTLGTVTIQNTSGVDIADGNGYNFDITDRLRLNGGVLNIGGSLLTVKRGGYVEAVSAFGENNMVQTNSSFTDNGFRQEFYTVAADTTVFFPVGELKYTPVQFDLDAGTTFGDIRVRPANEVHPSIVEDVEDEPNDKDIEDVNNALQYHWIVVAQDVTNARGEAIFYYDEGDVAIDNDYDNDMVDETPLWSEANYISARLLSNDTNWDKFDPSFFDAANDRFTVPLDQGSGVSASEITGDYTAGVGTSDGVNNDIDGAIPDQLAQYESVGDGNYSSAANWNPLNGSPAVTEGVGPVGAQIIVRNGDQVTIDISSIRLYSTEIEAGGILYVNPGTLSNRLGTVTGSGTIVLDDTELLPTGEYSDFLLCDGGGLQYSGSTDYSVLSGISQIRNVTFDGTGERIMPNNALDVCDVMTINGPDVTFDSGQTYNIGDDDSEADGLDLQAGTVEVSNGSVIAVTGDFTMSGGTLTGNAGTELRVTDDVNYSGGTLSWNNMDFVLNGTTGQSISGDFTGGSAIDDLTVNNSSVAGVTISSGDIEIDGLLTLTDGLVNTTSSETLTILSNGDWVGASTASYVTGPLTKVNIPVSSTYIFPVGKSARYARVAVANVVTGGDTWTAEYFTSTNPTYPDSSFDPSDPGSGKNAISDVKSTDRWEVTSAGSNSAQVRLAYGAHVGFADRDDIRVVWWDPIDMRWENRGAVTSGTAVSGTTQSEDFISFSTQQFGLADAPEIPVPVELVFFSANYADGKVNVSWQTASEINNDYFEIQRSDDGKSWEVVGRIDGAGDSNKILDYSFQDRAPYLGLSYYRLKQYDFDGVSETFDPVAVDNTSLGTGIEFALKPNPTVPENISFEFSTGDDHTVVYLRLLDMSGRVSFEKEFVPSGLSFEEKIIPTERLTAGLYFVHVIQGENAKVVKLILK